MDNNISENDKKLWNRVKNSTTKLNKEKHHNIKHSSEKNIKRPFNGNPFLDQSKKENQYELKEIVINEERSPKNLNDFANYKPGIDRKTVNKIKKGLFTIDAKLDLHGFKLKEAEKELTNFILEKFSKQEQNLLIISGKGKDGKGVIKNSIPNWLNKFPLSEKVYVFSSAQKRDGGEGAYFVRLRKNKT